MGGKVVMVVNAKRTSTQQSVNFIDYGKGYHPGMTANNFLTEFCNVVGNLRRSIYEDSFFYFKKSDKKLSTLLGFFTNLDGFDLEQSIRNIIYDLLLYGKTYAEVILFFDEKNTLDEIEIKPIRYKRQIIIFNKLYYCVKKFDGTYEFGHIDKQNLLIFNLKDMGFSKSFFKRRMKKLDKLDKNLLDLPSTSPDFNFDIYKKKTELKNLKIMKKVYWTESLRNKHISEPYLVYRSMKLHLLQKEFLDYVLGKYNEKLNQVGKEHNFTGKIRYKTKTVDYNTLINELQSGEKNCEQIADLIVGV